MDLMTVKEVARRLRVSASLFSFARHVCQLEGASPLSNLMEVKD